MEKIFISRDCHAVNLQPTLKEHGDLIAKDESSTKAGISEVSASSNKILQISSDMRRPEKICVSLALQHKRLRAAPEPRNSL